MRTESFRIADSQDSTYNGGYTGSRVKRTLRSDLPVPFLWDLRQALLDAGWTHRAWQTATVDFFVNTSLLPYTTPPPLPDDQKTVLSDPKLVYYASGSRIGAVADGNYVCFYDPNKEIAPPYPQVTWVAMGTSRDATLMALLGSIPGYMAISTGPWSSGTVATMQVNQPGPDGNDIAWGGMRRLTGDAAGVMTNAGEQLGGGYTLRATAWYGWMELTATADHQSTGMLRFVIKTSTGGAQAAMTVLNTALRGSASDIAFTVIANQFQFFIIHPTNGSVFAVLPYVDQLNAHGVTYAACCGQTQGAPYPWRTTLEWNDNVWGALNGQMQYSDNSYVGTRPGVFMSKGAGPVVVGALTDPAGNAILESAYLGIPPSGGPAGPDGQSRVAGLIWDALIARQDFALDTEASLQGFVCQAMMRSTRYSRPTGTVFIATRRPAS
jgi:hypothetical protein